MASTLLLKPEMVSLKLCSETGCTGQQPLVAWSVWWPRIQRSTRGKWTGKPSELVTEGQTCEPLLRKESSMKSAPRRDSDEQHRKMGHVPCWEEWSMKDTYSRLPILDRAGLSSVCVCAGLQEGVLYSVINMEEPMGLPNQ